MKQVKKAATKTGADRILIRSFSIPRSVAEEALREVPKEMAQNLNQMVTLALKTLIWKVKHDRFDEEMARMAADPQIQRESKEIELEFRAAEGDGL
jgi:hypothetical protein